MIKPDEMKINEEANVYHDATLDNWGNAFNFSHEKGLAEWLKNSIDAYLRIKFADKDQHVIFRFAEGNSSNPSTIECIDFVGMTHTDIQKAVKWWGDPNAASRGLNVRVYGGHGNGGKFYMRQMFRSSRFITYRDGKLNIFGFNENKKYGFADGFEDKSVSLEDALKIANIDISIIPQNLLVIMQAGKIGFTLVRGIQPKRIVGHALPVNQLCEKLKYHPQSRRPLKYCNVSVIYNGNLIFKNLRMEEIEPLKEFKDPFVFEIPEFLIDSDNHNKKIELANKKYQKGQLILRTSSLPFGRGGRKPELNCVDIIGEIGVIASYKMSEIGPLRYYPQAQSIYGECKCPILEDPEYDSVQNDRDKLAENDRTLVLRKWIASKIDEVGFKIADLEEKEEQKKINQTTDEFNQMLNKWKDQFMSKLFTEILGGPGKGRSTGGIGDEGSGGGKNENSETKGGLGSGKGEGGGEGDEKKKGSAMPRVLLSESEDPDFPGVIVTFAERHFAVEQRPQDVSRGIFWINRNKPMAKKILDKYGVDSVQWRNYLFQRYVDIFIISAIDRKAKLEGGSLTPDIIDTEIFKVVSVVNDKAIVDLEQFLVGEKFKTTNSSENEE